MVGCCSSLPNNSITITDNIICNAINSSYSYSHRNKNLYNSNNRGILENSSSITTLKNNTSLSTAAAVKNNTSLSTTAQNPLYCSNTVIQRHDYPVVETFFTGGINEGMKLSIL